MRRRRLTETDTPVTHQHEQRTAAIAEFNRRTRESDWIGVEGKSAQLVPGMEVTIEVKAGTRRVIDYFLSPVMRHGNESAKVR